MNAQLVRALGRAADLSSRCVTPDFSNLESFHVQADGTCNSVWVTRRANSASHVTLDQLLETERIDAWIKELFARSTGYKVLQSEQAGRFSLGGDLALFVDCIMQHDRRRLSHYAKLALDAVHRNLCPDTDGRLTTVALVAGEAQGGGFEAALSCHVIVAERGSNFGFPEPLFGLFPGMGAALMLGARIGVDAAEKLTSSANRYSAEFLFELGVIDYLVDSGCGEQFAERLLLRGSAEGSVEARKISMRKGQLSAIPRRLLEESVSRWCDQALSLEERSLRSMRYIVQMQQRQSV